MPGLAGTGSRNALVQNLTQVRGQLTSLQGQINSLVTAYVTMISQVQASVTANDGIFSATDLAEIQSLAASDKAALKAFVAGL